MLVGPAPPANKREEMVEPPGIAPGSGPLITSAFIAIVRANPDRTNIGTKASNSKVLRDPVQNGASRSHGPLIQSTSSMASAGAGAGPPRVST